MVEQLIICDEISIPFDEFEFQAIRARGAGGQNVNKVASAIHLRFDFQASESIDDKIRERLASLDDARVTSNGIVIKAQEFRSQARNKQAAIERLQELVQSVLVEPKPRIATRPSKKTRQQRVDSKRRKGAVKRSRGRVDDE